MLRSAPMTVLSSPLSRPLWPRVAQSQIFRARRLRFGLNPEPDYCDHCEGRHSHQRHRRSSQALVPLTTRQLARNIGPSSTAELRPHRLGCLRMNAGQIGVHDPEVPPLVHCVISFRCGIWSLSASLSPAHEETAASCVWPIVLWQVAPWRT